MCVCVCVTCQLRSGNPCPCLPKVAGETDEAREVQHNRRMNKKIPVKCNEFFRGKGSHLATPTIINKTFTHSKDEREGHTQDTVPQSCLSVCLSVYVQTRTLCFMFSNTSHPYDVTLPDFIGQSDWPTSILTLYFSTQ